MLGRKCESAGAIATPTVRLLRGFAQIRHAWAVLAIAVLLAKGAATTVDLKAEAAPPAPLLSGQAVPETSAMPPVPHASPASLRRGRLRPVSSWRYQLRRIETKEIAASEADLLVIDYAPDRVYGVELPFTPEDVAYMKSRPGGGKKLLLAYLSIGEAERYRTYWNNAWYDAPTRPAWLLDANPQWEGNFPVRFWDPQWQALVFGSPEAYLDRILAAGFDGVYLDRADVFQELLSERADSEDLMVRFIVALARYARSKKPDALIVMQNAEELVRHTEIRSVIDGLAKEDLLFGVHHDETPNPPDMVRDTLSDLAIAKRSGLKILVVEYLSTKVAAERASRRISDLGFLPLIGERSLGKLLFEPAPATPVGPATAPSAQPSSSTR